jgi:hypothetical protein
MWLLLSEVFGYEWNQCKVTSTLDRTGQLSLKFCTCTCYTTWKDFPLVVSEFFDDIDIFVIDVYETGFSEQTFSASVIGFLWVLWIF